jgi:uncharacterized protein (TIGR02145 family)
MIGIGNNILMKNKGSSFPTEVVDVVSATGRIWMDRNLGATRAATSSADAEAYGDLYQWGRLADGHEKRTSATTSVLSSTDVPGHGDFILTVATSYDWRNPQNDNLWQGMSSINDICPEGYRLPTEAEWNAEIATWSSQDPAGAFDSSLKLPIAGARSHIDGSFNNVGIQGAYWSSTIDSIYSRHMFFYSNKYGSGAIFNSVSRGDGYSVRCIKD